MDAIIVVSAGDGCEMFVVPVIETSLEFVMFLHLDLRSDGLIAAACCNWAQGGASECRMAWY